MEEVFIICSTPAFNPAFKTLKVPSTATGNRSSLLFETFIGNGEAKCNIYLHPAAASFHPSSLKRSNSINDNLSIEAYLLKVFLVWSIKLLSLTVPRTS